MATSSRPETSLGAQSWHALSAEQVLQTLGSGDHGLSAAEAARRLAELGPNRLAEAKPPGVLERLARQFNNLLLMVLMATSLITALMGHWVDTAVIAAIVVLNAVIGFVQEGKAEKTLQANRAWLHALRSNHNAGQIAAAVRDAAHGRALAQAGVERILNPFDDAADFAAEQLARNMHDKETT